MVFLHEGNTPDVATGALGRETGTPTESPTMSLNGYILDLLPDYTLGAMEDPDSPQSLAYRFLVEDPSISTYSEERIRQRFALVSFFRATGGEEWTSSANWVTYSDECTWWSQRTYGVEDDEEIYEGFDSNPCSDRQNSSDASETYQQLWLWQNGLQGKY